MCAFRLKGISATGPSCRLQRVVQPRMHAAHTAAAVQSGTAAQHATAVPHSTKLIALKEWAVTAAALGAGEQTVLLRKGGIKEPRFTPEADRFVIFPTSFHTEQQLLKPGAAERYADEMQMEPRQLEVIPIAQYAEVTGCWTTEDERVLKALDPLHVWADGFLETRLKWRKTQPITLLELRAYRLQPPIALPSSPELFGCFSWVGLPGVDEAAIAAALGHKVAALDDVTFAEKQKLLRERLADLDAQPLLL